MENSDAYQETETSEELRAWLTMQKQALHVRQALRFEGGHVMLKNSVIDANELEEPLRSEALAYLKSNR